MSGRGLARPWLLALLTAALGACDDAGSPVGQDGAAPDAALPDAAPDLGGPDALADQGPPLPDQFVPLSLSLTVNEIPALMNGSQPYLANSGQLTPFQLAVPRHGFTLDVRFGGSLARPDTLVVTADVPLGTGSARRPAGSNLAPLLQGSGEQRSVLLPAELALPAGQVTFSATLGDGSQQLADSLTVQVVEKTFLNDPFRLEDTWLLVLEQDLYTIQRVQDAQGALAVSSKPSANGVADFDEDLRLVGLGSDSELPAAATVENDGVVGASAIVRAWLLHEALASLRALFHLQPDGSQGPHSVRIRFLLQGAPGAPALSDFTPQTLTGGETEKAFSAIAIGGGDLSSPYLGYSKTMDPFNLQSEDSLGPAYGVFTTKVVQLMLQAMAINPTVELLLGRLLEDFIPELGQGGKPVGQHPLDAEILSGAFDPATAAGPAADRHDKLAFLVQTLGRLLGALVAHEIGHALGLVVNGPPPHGLFGGEKNAAFTNGARTTGLHIDTPGFNVMQAGPGTAGFDALMAAELLTVPRFNALNLAYLRGRLLLLPGP